MSAGRSSIGRWSTALWLAGLAAAVAVVPAGAVATNLAPNPSFENDCSGIPCSWTGAADPGASASIFRVTTVAHSGSASLRVQAATTQASQRGWAQSTCITGISPSTTYWIDYWAREDDTNLFSFAGWADFYSDANCTTLVSTGVPGIGVAASHQNAWNEYGTNAPSPSTAHSARVFLGVRCNAAGACAANFDDVWFGTATLAATFRSLTASRTLRGVVVRWRTATEAEVLGFHVYRQVGPRRVRLTRTLVAARGRVSGARYAYVDRRPARRPARYWVRVVDLHGRGTWQGPVVVR